MHDLDDNALLREYVERDSGDAFAEIVTRHVNKVYSVALRHAGNPHSAEEITQAVFVILARKSRDLSRHVLLSGWLYQTARLTAVTHTRSEIRRTRREQETHMQTGLNENESDVWKQIAPLLDVAMAGLNETDRHAVVLRFFDGKSLGEVAAALGASEHAAKKRVNRAVEKLRKFFTKRGIMLPAAVLMAAISANSVQAAPLALAKSVTAVAIAKGAAASGSTLTLIKGALKIMAWTKVKTTIVVSVVVLLAAATTTTVTIREIRARPDYWEVQYLSYAILEHAQPQVSILPAKFNGQLGWIKYPLNGKMMGIGVPMEVLLHAAYGDSPDFKTRLVLKTQLPDGRYDFISNLNQGASNALQHAISEKFGLTIQREVINTNVLLLRVRTSNAAGLNPGTLTTNVPVIDSFGQTKMMKSAGGITVSYGHIYSTGSPIQDLAYVFEDRLGIPVIDQTGLTENFIYDLKWNEPNLKHPNTEGLKQAVFDQLGLELVPTNMPIEMLVIEKAP